MYESIIVFKAMHSRFTPHLLLDNTTSKTKTKITIKSFIVIAFCIVAAVALPAQPKQHEKKIDEIDWFGARGALYFLKSWNLLITDLVKKYSAEDTFYGPQVSKAADAAITKVLEEYAQIEAAIDDEILTRDEAENHYSRGNTALQPLTQVLVAFQIANPIVATKTLQTFATGLGASGALAQQLFKIFDENTAVDWDGARAELYAVLAVNVLIADVVKDVAAIDDHYSPLVVQAMDASMEKAQEIFAQIEAKIDSQDLTRAEAETFIQQRNLVLGDPAPVLFSFADSNPYEGVEALNAFEIGYAASHALGHQFLDSLEQ